MKRAAGKRGNSKSLKKQGPLTTSFKLDDEEISSEASDNALSDDDSEASEENPETKRKRLAKEYLNTVKTADEDEEDSLSDEAVTNKLQRERLESKGKLFRALSANAEKLTEANITTRAYSGHSSSITCMVLSKDERTCFSGSKDNSVQMWDIETGTRTEIKRKWNRKTNKNTQSHDGEVLSMALSSDSRYLVTGGRDNVVRVYDSRSKYSEIQAFKGHRGHISCLSFQVGTYELFSGSADRCIKHWDLNEMGYIETLFGHQDGINAMDCMSSARPISASSDRSLRIWKVADQSHLVFRGHKSSIDNVRYITSESYLSCGQDGSLNLWKDSQKNPVATEHAAHGVHSQGGNAQWLSSLATLNMSDLAATGSSNGTIKLWDVSAEKRTLRCVNELQVEGFVNSLILTPNMVVAGCGAEHRLGRWWKIKGNRNKLITFRFDKSLAEINKQEEGEEGDVEESDSDDNEDEESEGSID